MRWGLSSQAIDSNFKEPRHAPQNCLKVAVREMIMDLASDFIFLVLSWWVLARIQTQHTVVVVNCLTDP